jgi:hypothetical protein
MEKIIKRNDALEDMVRLALPLAESDPLKGTSSYTYRLVRSVLRKNLMRVQSVVLLNKYEKLGDSSLEIVRNMIEDAITVSYILSSTDPEALAKCFFEYRHIQAKQDLNYYTKFPDYTDEYTDITAVNGEYKRVMTKYPEFKNKDGSPRHSWSIDGVEGMAKKLVKRNIYRKQEVDNMLRAYQLGSRKVHLNPDDLLKLYDQKSWDVASIRSASISIRGAAASLTSIVVRYHDTIRHYDKNIDTANIDDKLYDLIATINAV